MKRETSKLKGKNEMKTANHQVTDREAQEPLSEQMMVENQIIEERLQQLIDLAKDGDEIAAAELDLYFALT